MRHAASGASRYYAVLIVALIASGAVLVGFSLYEKVVLGEYRLGIGSPPAYTAYYLGRLALVVLLSWIAVVALYRRRDGAAGIDAAALDGGKRAATWAMLAFATACTLFFVVDPVLYYEFGLEDGALEWASALLPLACSGVFAYAFLRILRSNRHDGQRNLALALTALFAIGLFVIGMEEISWMQRVFEIETPAMFAGNQQQEMNLHNMHSIAFGSMHRLAVFGGAIVLPFLAETAPRLALIDKLADFLPSRFVLVISAPFAALDYNSWNFVMAPLIAFLTLAILFVYAGAAHARGDRKEVTLFVALATFLVAAQVVYLALGHRQVRNWDISEYRELLMAIGLAVFTWETAVRLRAHYGRAQGPYRALTA